jgi:hypothetical protein
MRKYVKLVGIALFAWLFATLSSSAIAQIDYSSTYIQAPLWDSINSSNPIMTEDFSSGSIFDKAAPAAKPQSLKFVPNNTQRKKNIADYVARVAKIAPDYAPQLAAEYADGSVFNQYGLALMGVGLDANDLGDNFTVWWMSAWEASMGRPVSIAPASFASVREQVGRVLAGKAFAVMSNVQKQKFSDSLAIQAMILSNQIKQAKADPLIAKQLAVGIKQGAKKLGLDLDAMTLTDKGFVPVKRR